MDEEEFALEYSCEDMMDRQNDGPLGQEDHENLAVHIPGVDHA